MFAIFLCLVEDLFASFELFVFVIIQVVVPEQLARPQLNLGLGPVLQELFFDLLEVHDAVLENTGDELFGALVTPVVALLDVEVFEVERAIV